MNEIFTNAAPYLCPVTYTFEVDNLDTFGNAAKAGLEARFVIDPSDTRMTFTYDNASNKYDGKTIHYKVKALTDADKPLYVTITVIDKTTQCKESTLSFNDANVLSYPTEVYKAAKVSGATLNSIYTNSDNSKCPITEELIL